MRPERAGSQCETSVKVELVLRLLGGETLTALASETGRPRKQLSAWRQRFLAGGEAYLDGRPDRRAVDALERARTELSERVAQLEAENTMLARRTALLHADRSRDLPHPYCSAAHARALEEPGVQPLHVPEWGTYVLVREGRGRTRHATGVRPIAPLDPGCDARAGLEALARAGIASVSLIADPMWCPDLAVLQGAFDVCRPFREHYFVDREAEVHYHKKHRNRLNQARRACSVEEVGLAEHLARWHELYAENVANRQIPQPFARTYFERIATLPSLRTIAVRAGGEVVALTLWIRHRDTRYLHEAATSATGFELSAGYAALAHVIENETECRYVLLGGSAGFRDERLEGLAMFRRGFSNGSAPSYLCSATLRNRTAGAR
jgi:transposase-like protein